MAKLKEKAFEKVLAWLDAGAPHEQARGMKFDMAEFVTVGSNTTADENWCGTACCIAGAALVFNKEQVLRPLVEIATSKIQKVGCSNWDLNGVSDSVSLWREAKQVLGVSQQQATLLFAPFDQFEDELLEIYPDLKHDDWPDDARHITPAWAARTIRHLIETGEVRWDKTKRGPETV